MALNAGIVVSLLHAPFIIIIDVSLSTYPTSHPHSLSLSPTKIVMRVCRNSLYWNFARVRMRRHRKAGAPPTSRTWFAL